jgi:hypothetical protein
MAREEKESRGLSTGQQIVPALGKVSQQTLALDVLLQVSLNSPPTTIRATIAGYGGATRRRNSGKSIPRAPEKGSSSFGASINI